MKYSKRTSILLFPFILFLFSHYAYSASFVKKPKWIDGEVVVKFKKGVDNLSMTSVLAGQNIKTLHKYRNNHLQHLKLPKNMTVDQAILHLKNHPLIEIIEPNYLYYADIIPDDTSFPAQWGADNTGQTGGTFDADMDLPEAWDITTGSSEVVVAVIDSGANLIHPDLVDNIWINPGEIPGNGVDDDNNGYIDDVNGWDFVRNDNDPSPVGGVCVGHGTHTAGIIGARGNNTEGISGVAWNVKIMPLNTFYQFLGSFCVTSNTSLLKAIDYYTMMGVRISSNSYGGALGSNVMRDAIRESKSIFIAAAGNNGTNNDTTPSYPANYGLDNIVAVAATDHNDLLADFSNFGNTVDVGAPGVDILSTVPGDTYASFSGTSMATPQVAGIAALLLSHDSTLTNNEVIWRILKGVDSTSINVGTNGRVNAFNSLQFGLNPVDVIVAITPVGATTVPVGGTVTYTISLTNNTASDQTAQGILYVQGLTGENAIIAGPGSVTIPAGETLSAELSHVIPNNFVPQDLEFFVAAETANSLDEEKLVFTITP